jgi:hypothetical protein
MLALWREDYGRAADLFDRVAQALAETREHRAFWLAMRALALKRWADYGDRAATTQMHAALRAAAAAGAVSTYFTRLRFAEARIQSGASEYISEGHDGVFAAWDRRLDRYGASGPRFERWSARLLSDLGSSHHDTIARAVAELGRDVLGLAADAPVATAGEEDAYWELVAPRRTMTFEVKLAPQAQRVVNDDVEQAEGAARAAEMSRGSSARGLLISPHDNVDQTAEARLERVRLIKRDTFVNQAERLLDILRDYRRGWSDDAGVRAERRANVASQLPSLDWLWRAVEQSRTWVDNEALDQAWSASGHA